MVAVRTFRLVITSVTGAQFDGDAISATLPGSAGEMTILAHHEPLVSTLRKGSIKVRTEQGSQEIKVEKGVVECSSNRVTILV
ncbi:MAG: F-type H+-transporting ATPase subunit epsilon [Parcubacteria group bacterium Gr01-1014_8]|nr:MAG: F-type H+-transporting ATPase subunit epsilon [Parcubacteria group bacterium Gr01-1014_8]